ncbi:hypothetical protein ABPG75_003095 [Micractinium tetrahymenae]
MLSGVAVSGLEMSQNPHRGVAVSGLEMSQNRVGLQWSRAEVEARLEEIMRSIYATSKAAASEYGTTLSAGANIAAFLKVGEAVLAQGAV